MSEPTKARVHREGAQVPHSGSRRAYEELGVMPVLASAAGYRFRDLDGREFQDFHLNGGTFNLGHRNPELLAVLERSLQAIGIGNHHFVSCSRADLAEALVRSLAGMRYVVLHGLGQRGDGRRHQVGALGHEAPQDRDARCRLSRKNRPVRSGGRRRQRQILLLRFAGIPARAVRRHQRPWSLRCPEMTLPPSFWNPFRPPRVRRPSGGFFPDNPRAV